MNESSLAFIGGPPTKKDKQINP